MPRLASHCGALSAAAAADHGAALATRTLMAMTPASVLGEAPTVAARLVPGRALPIGTRLRDYEISGMAGESAVGVVYAAWDHSLQRKVAVKEYMPESMASRSGDSAAVIVRPERLDTFKAGLRSFVDEARLLARFDHPSLLKVYRFWEDNGTAYTAMPFHDGPTLKNALAELGHVPSETELRAWLRPILDAVTVLHGGRTWHGHIAPDEILLTPTGPVLLGFGAAARAIAEADRTPAAALSPGFAAPEQYGPDGDAACGPWTDLYALSAVVYSAIAGAPPDDATDRLTGDALQLLSQVASGLYGAGFLAAVDAALALDPKARPQDHAAFRALMGDIETAEAVSLAPPRDLMLEPFLGDASSHREITVPDRPVLAAAIPAATPAATTAAKDARKGPLPALPARDASETAPTWMKAAGQRRLGQSARYGLVAATCIGIGIVAMALQSWMRPTPAPMPATTTAGRPSAPPAASIAVPTSNALPNAVTVPVTPAAVAAAFPASSAPATTATAAERQAHCIDILQKASLEKISGADTEFFKRECK